MSEDAVIKYREALKQRTEALREVQKLGDIVVEAGKGLRDPLDFKVSNSGVSFLAIGSTAHALNASSWPSAKQVAEAVSMLQRHDAATTNAWQSIPKEERYGLTEPERIGR